MTHGHPDYGPTAAISTVYTTLDIAELAARLGSIVTFDRRGNVIWLDDFESSFNKWDTSLFGAGGSVAITNERARSGAFSVKVVTGNATNDYAHLYHSEPYPVLSRLGLELSLLTIELKAVFYFIFDIYTGTHRHSAAIKFEFETRTWFYRSSDSTWVTLPTTARLIQSYYMFNTVKLVFDPITHKYVRLIANNVTYDMSDLAYWYTPDPGSPRIPLQITFYPTENDSKIIYYDNVILTQNEP